MKKLLSLAAIAVMFVACGNDSPEEVAKKCMIAGFKFDAKQMLDCGYYKTEDEKNIASKKVMEQIEAMKKNFPENLNFSVETSTISELENIAKVKIIATMKADGKEGKLERTEKLIKIDNKWYLERPF